MPGHCGGGEGRWGLKMLASVGEGWVARGFVRAAQLLGGEAGGERCRDPLCKAWG